MKMCSNTLVMQFQRWRVWIRPLLILIYALFVIIVVPLLIVNSVKDGFTKKDQLILIGGLFVLTSLPISIWHITQHIVHFTKPILQKPIIRILWMVPIYALDAWLGLLFPSHSVYVDSIRECYEAYVIYNFMAYLLNYLNLEMDLEATLELKPPVAHIFPLCHLKPWAMGREFVHNCKHGILQYTVVRPITTLISVICEMNGVYGEGSFKVDVAFPYIIAINNITQFTAMYCLVLFYKANKTELKPMKPLPKFLCIKAVVFFSFFQGLIINILVYFGYFKNIFGSGMDEDYQSLAGKLQNFLICIEMFLAAIAHHYSFPHDPFHINIPHYGPNGNWYNAFLAMLDISDVHQDVSDHIGVVGSSLSRRLRGRSMYQTPNGSESDYLIPTHTIPAMYQSGIDNSHSINAVSNVATSSTKGYGTTIGHNNMDGGINIVQQMKKNYSPQIGQPSKSTLLNSEFIHNDGNRMHHSDNSDTTTSTTGGGGGGGARGQSSSGFDPSKIKKSDSSGSDWLSSPTDEMMGIDVKGVGTDKINLTYPKM